MYSALLLAFLLPAWIAAGGDTEAGSDASPADSEVRDLINKRIIKNLQSSRRARLSRARPRSPERKIELNVAETEIDGDDESYFAFAVLTKSPYEDEWFTEIRGCIYSDSHSIFVYDETADTFVPPESHPAVVPRKKKAQAKATETKSAPCTPKQDITT